MKQLARIQPPVARRPADEADGAWANSTDLYLLTCYDVWSATPARGCEPAVAHPDDSMCPVA